MSGSLTISEYPDEIVRLSCEKCGRSGQYRKQTLIERYGADMRLPDLREEIAKCGRQGHINRSLPGRNDQMRFLSIGICLAWLTIFVPSSVYAQNTVPIDKPESTTGPTLTPETKGQKQPQGWTGPTNTGQGGAPASSPQGQSPPGMQSAPEGSSKTTTAPDKDVK